MLEARKRRAARSTRVVLAALYSCLRRWLHRPANSPAIQIVEKQAGGTADSLLRLIFFFNLAQRVVPDSREIDVIPVLLLGNREHDIRGEFAVLIRSTVGFPVEFVVNCVDICVARLQNCQKA